MSGSVNLGIGQPDPLLARIGEIGVSQHWAITPAGSYPIRGSVWTVSDMSRWDESMSPVGVVLCILFIWICLLGLLFLLMKDRRMTGYIQVTVQGNGFHYSTMIPAVNSESVWHVTQSVNYARSLAALA